MTDKSDLELAEIVNDMGMTEQEKREFLKYMGWD